MHPSGSAESNQAGNSLVYSGPALATCNLLATLLDVIGHRLADTLLPEVRLQTLISLVNLFRLWSSSPSTTANAMPGSSEEARLGRDGRFSGSSFEIPLELFYKWAHILRLRMLFIFSSFTQLNVVQYKLEKSSLPLCADFRVISWWLVPFPKGFERGGLSLNSKRFVTSPGNFVIACRLIACAQYAMAETLVRI